MPSITDRLGIFILRLSILRTLMTVNLLSSHASLVIARSKVIQVCKLHRWIIHNLTRSVWSWAILVIKTFRACWFWCERDLEILVRRVVLLVINLNVTSARSWWKWYLSIFAWISLDVWLGIESHVLTHLITSSSNAEWSLHVYMIVLVVYT